MIAHRADLEATDSANRTALERAASHIPYSEQQPQDSPWPHIVKALLKAGAYYDIRSAIYLNDLARVRAILKKDMNRARKDRGRLLCAAAQNGRHRIVSVLLEHKADPNANVEGVNYMTTPLAEGIRYPRIVKLLLDAGAEATVRTSIARDYHDAAPLDLAARSGVVESAELGRALASLLTTCHTGLTRTATTTRIDKDTTPNKAAASRR